MTRDEAHAENRIVAGLSCMDVLGQLSAFLDGELPDEDVARIGAHVAGCSTCERFGGRFADAITRLRQAADPAPDPGVGARLADRLGL